jgi:hypothetical protein
MAPRGVGEVGLQHDAGFEVLQAGLVEDAREGRDRQVEVAVLLHVEVDELRLALSFGSGGELVERSELLDDIGHRLVERPHRQLAHDAGHLDRDVVDVVAGEEVAGALQTVPRFALAEHGLAEEVEVQAVAALAQLRDRGAELGGRGIQHEVPDHGAQHATRDRHDDAGDLRRPEAAGLDRGPQVAGQQRRGDVAQLGELAAGDAQVFRTHHAVDEADRERESVRVLEHFGQALGGRLDGVGLALDEPALHQGGDVFGTGSGGVGGDRHRWDLPRERTPGFRVRAGSLSCRSVGSVYQPICVDSVHSS